MEIELKKNNTTIIVKRKNKTFKNRKLSFYKNNKFFMEVEKYAGWYCLSKKINNDDAFICRHLIMENLYWLLGNDCDFKTWVEIVDDFNTTPKIYGVPIDRIPKSMFHNEDEYNTAINSYYNK